MSLAIPDMGPAVVTLGVFDGVHRGHRLAAEATTAAARARDARSVALVFDPPPIEIIRPGTSVRRLLPVDLVLSGMLRAGIDEVVEIAFNLEVRDLSPEAFLAALQPGIELRGVAMTAGSSFGRERAGTLERVAAIGAERGFDVIELPTLESDGVPISSSRIRAALDDGDVEEAASLLGSEPMLRGAVTHGDGRGRLLGFPTANLAFDYNAAVPAHGIYIGRADVPHRGVGPAHPALVSIGVRPTFHAAAAELVEVHLLDWNGDLYDSSLSVRLARRLRGESRFESADALVAQMRIDEAMARQFFESGQEPR